MPLSLGLDLDLLNVPEETRIAVAGLVEQYRRHRPQYQAGAFKEAWLRSEFLDPFFEAFGWDVRNRQGHAPRYREVVVEDTVEVDGGKRAPDYCFRLGEKPVFYVEAKAPSVSIREAASPAYQVRRYGFSARLPLCLLTDFEELAIYDWPRRQTLRRPRRVYHLRTISRRPPPALLHLLPRSSPQGLLRPLRREYSRQARHSDRRC